MENFDEFLEHAVKQPYDPVARRERYLRERELKGRTSGAGKVLLPTKRSSKDKTPEKQTAQQKAVTAAQKQAQRRIENISKKLEDWVESRRLSDAKDSRQITADAKRKIEALPEIPKWVTPATRQRLLKARQLEAARIREDAGKEKNRQSRISANKQKDKAAASQKEREKVAKDLKAAIEKIRKSAASGR